MTTTPDLHTSAERLATVVRNVRDDQLDGPTPCPNYSVGDLLDHIGGFALAFRGAAEKDMSDLTSARRPVMVRNSRPGGVTASGAISTRSRRHGTRPTRGTA